MFNHELSIDRICLEGRLVVHIVDTHTGFQGAVLLRWRSAGNMWTAFLGSSIGVYLGYPCVMRVDHESAITSASFRADSKGQGTLLQLSFIESHNYLSAVERHHDPLRRVFSILLLRHPSLYPSGWRPSIKGIKCMMRPIRLIPTLLVFGSLPYLVI